MRTVTLLLPLLALLLLSSCVTFTPRVNSVANSLERDLENAHFDKEFGLKFGRLTTSLARGVAGWALDEQDQEERTVLETLRGVRRIEVATYETQGDLTSAGPFRVEQKLERRGWQTVARIREDDGFTWVVYRERDQTLTGFMVIALDADELTLVDLRGDVERTLAAALRLASDGDQIAGLSGDGHNDPLDPSFPIDLAP